MKRMIRSIVVFSLLFSWLEGFSQNLSNRGKDFWVGYGHHQFMEPGQDNSQQMVLYLSAEQPANVTVTIEGTTWVRNYSIPANTVIASEYIPKGGAVDARLISVPCSFTGGIPPCGGEGTFSNKAIHIVSDVPIVAYAHIFGSASSGASMLMPVETWGYSYISVNSIQNYAANCYSWVYAIAQHDNTLIEVTPAVVTRAGKPANVSFTVTLNRGDIYQTMAGPETGSAKPEMTGTKIRSIANASGDCYPIAVFSGSSRTSNPASCGSGGGDNDNQQCFPSIAWGKRYLTAPTSNSNTASTPMVNSYKIVVKDPATVVKRNGTVLTGIINNSYYRFESGTADYIEADKPVMVAQFMTGGSACQGGGGVGDPEMMYISPIEQGIKRIGFYRNTREAITVNYLTLIIPTNGVPSLLIDGASPPYDHSYPHPQLPGYTVVIKRWNSSSSQCIVSSDSAFTAITYGLGSVESYGYNAGTLINNLSAVSSIHNTLDPATPQHAFTCTGTPVQLSVLMRYQPTRLDWLLSQLGSVITPNADVIDNAPVSTGTVVVNGLTYYKYTLPATYTFNAADTFDIPINAYNPAIENCYQREQLSVPVIVKESPLADFTFTHTGCTLDTVHFSGTATTSNSFTIRDFNWTFPGPVTATGQFVNKLLPPGTHTINLSVVSNEGCVGDTAKQITIYDKPPANFQVTPTSLCEGAAFTLTDTSSATVAVNQWYWDFGNGITQTVTTGPTVSYTYPSPGTYTIKHVSRSSSSCVSDTVYRQITVYSKPNISFITSPTGCLNVTGDVQFTGNVTTPDGQAITNYAWIFNDPNSIPGNDNTSALQNPVHSFHVGGAYNIQFSAVTANGCADTVITPVTFNLKPQLAFTQPNPVCENTPGPINIAGAFVVNNVPGTGIYHGPGADAAGNFNPSVAGPGQHTYWYVFTSTAGCVDSMSMDILVYGKPHPNFNFSNNGCLPANGQVQFNNTSTIADAQTMSWLWNFNDPNANAGNPNTSTAQNPTHNFGEGAFNIKLLATSSNGCKDSITIPTTFALTPIINYPALNPICQNAAAISVATATITNNVTGTGVYSGPGTSASGQFDPAIAGPGNHTITYTFTTTGGCVQSTTQTILVHAKPIPGFTIPNTGCLPANGQVQFNNTSTITDGQTMSWLWNFNDPNANASNPNTSTAQNPTHNFGEGAFNIKLVVTSSNGCADSITVPATFAVTPILNFAPLSPLCENAAGVSVATATVTNNITGTGAYSGPGTSASGQFNPSIAGPGNHTITYTFTTSGGCVQSITQTILVYARPKPNFSFPTGTCLPAAGFVQFNNTTSIADGQTMSWAWNFSDPNANGTNPNTSTLQNPTHNFGEGSFPVNLSVTSSNGCVKDTTITAVFKVTPALVYSSLSPVCQNPGAAPSSVAGATVTNPVTGTGVYSGPGTNTSGLFDPNVAGPGIHTITYTFTTTGGCTQSATTTIEVYPRPDASFTSTNSICLNQPATFTNTSAIPTGTITAWNWNLGNGNTPSYTNGNPFNVTYAAANNYTVQLVTVSDKGCFSTPYSQTVAVHPLPVANFNTPVGICMPGGTATFTNLSTVPDNSGLSYQWNFGDGTGTSTATNPSYVYGGIGSYNVTLTATSTFGCVNTSAPKVVSDFYDKPVASFSVTPDELCQGVNTVFTDQSSAPNSSVQGWNWNFGDGSSPSTVQTPTKKFNDPGTYNVTLTVTNTVGCTSDPFPKTVTVHLQPVIDAGRSFVVPQGTTVQFEATANSPSLTFSWTPPAGLSDPTALRPTLVAMADQDYTLVATGDFGCTATDFISVKILKPVKVPNVFSPNGDGIHDKWIITNLADYPGCRVEVFNRYGQQVFASSGYGTPWDGRYNGKDLPFGTYYYVITLENGFKPMTGSITIVK